MQFQSCAWVKKSLKGKRSWKREEHYWGGDYGGWATLEILMNEIRIFFRPSVHKDLTLVSFNGGFTDTDIKPN